MQFQWKTKQAAKLRENNPNTNHNEKKKHVFATACAKLISFAHFIMPKTTFSVGIEERETNIKSVFDEPGNKVR